MTTPEPEETNKKRLDKFQYCLLALHVNISNLPLEARHLEHLWPLLESVKEAHTELITAHTKAAVIEARIDTAQTLRKALSPHKGALAIIDNEIKQLKGGTE